jgi:2-octaprenyl-6-methoxyphenol hydroxylase
MQMHDISIIGAGPVGALAALALHAKQSTHSVTLLDAAAPDAVAYERTLALSYGSRLLLEHVGVWQTISPAPQPIEAIDVTQRGGAGHAVIRASECDVPALGYTLTYTSLKAAMDAALDRAGVQVRYHSKVERVTIDPTCATLHLAHSEKINCAMVVVADGGNIALPGMKSFVRDHGQSAVVAQVQVTAPQSTMAFERFATQGPIALLPLDANGRYGLVWTHRHDAAPQICSLERDKFASEAHAAFGNDLGNFTLLNTPRHYPLGLKYLEPRARPRLLAIGNAAQSMHPIAGQGLNLGLRDAWAFAEQFHALPASQFGAILPAIGYGLRRASDRVGGVLMTESLVSAFGIDLQLASVARGAGIGALDVLAPVKRALARRMMFGA